MEMLYRSETIAVRCVPAADRSRWVITFDHHSIGAGFDRPGFSEEFLHEHGVSAIHMLGVGDDWYQYPDTLQACAVARAATRDAVRRIAYGSSMGAYAAVRLGDAVGADAILALSPLYSNDPQVAPWEHRWELDAARIDWQPQLRGPMRCACRPILVTDPATPDAPHIALIARDTPSTIVPIHYGGHPVATFLGEVGLLRPLLFSVIDDTFDAAAFAAQVRARRSSSSVYLYDLAERQPKVRAGLATRLARRAAAVNADGLLGTLALAQIRGKAGDYTQALALHETTVRDSNRAMRFLIPYAEALIASGEAAAAVPVAREVMKIDPGKPHLHHWLAWVLFRAEDRASAIVEEKIALTLAPGTPRYRKALRRYESAILSWIALWRSGAPPVASLTAP